MNIHKKWTNVKLFLRQFYAYPVLDLWLTEKAWILFNIFVCSQKKNARRIAQSCERTRLSLDPETRKPQCFSQFRGVHWVSGRKNRQENSQRGSLLSHLAGEIFANFYKWPQLLSFFFLNNPKSLFINPLPRADGNKFDLSRLFDPVYYSERTHSETS